MREFSLRFWLLIAVAVIVFDHITKYLITANIDYQDFVPLAPFFSLVLVHNHGAAFSMLADAGGWQRWFFIGVGIVATVIIVRQLRRHRNEPRMSLALALLLGGALGNVIDRVVLGYVVDFLYFHWGEWAFPAFNVADSAITVGAALLIWDSFARPAEPKATT